MALRRTLSRMDKSMFADKRRVIHPVYQTPSAPSSYLKHAFTTDPMKESATLQFFSSGTEKRDVLDAPSRLEGAKSRAAIERGRDPEFDALVEFVRARASTR